MTHKLFTDGGARGNPGPSGIGATLQDSSKNTVAEVSKYIGECTNNEAEYTGLIAGLALAQKNNVSDLNCFLDSELVVKQLNGQYKVKNERLKKYYDRVKEEASKFNTITFAHVKRKENARADELVNQALDAHLSK